MRKCRALFIPLHLLAVILVVPYLYAADGNLKKVSFIPQWVPQTQFSGYYVALERGIYKKHGLDLTILEGGPTSPPLDFLKEGKADIATLWLTTGIQARAQGIRLVNIAQIVQKSALMLVAKKSKGIRSPQDLRGKKVGMWGPIFQIQPRAFLRKYNLNVTVIPQSFSINLFLRDGVDAASAMWYNEYHTILNCGINPEELTSFFFYDHGLNFPEDGIYVLEETFRRNPELCRDFVQASIEGWRYAFNHPEEALDVAMKNLKRNYIPATRVHQKWMLERMKDLIMPEDLTHPVGKLLPADYERVAGELYHNGFIKTIPPFHLFQRKCHTDAQ